MKLIVVDIGNTNIKIALVDLTTNEINKKLTLPTKKDNPKDYEGFISKQIKKQLIANVEQKIIKDVFLISVVPKVNSVLVQIFQELVNKTTIVFKPSMVGLNDNEPCGHDSIALWFGANKIANRFIIISMGTATVFLTTDFMPKGVIIASGLEINKKSLLKEGILTKDFKKCTFKNVLTKNPEEGSQIGLLWGHVGMVEYIIDRIWARLGKKVVVLFTGGNYLHLKKYLRKDSMFKVMPNLVISGMVEIYKIRDSWWKTLLSKTIGLFSRFWISLTHPWTK